MRRFLVLLGLAAFAGCATDSPGSAGGGPSPAAGSGGGESTPPTLPPGNMVRPVSTAPLPVIRTSAPRDPSLIAGDMISISVYQQADLTTEVRLPEAGTFSFPLIGTVEALGRTPAAVEADIRERLAKDFLQDPFVTLTVQSFAPRKVYVLGGVQKPSGYEIQPTERITLLQLISAAGGITDKAYKEFVQIVRRSGPVEREVILLSLVDIERAIAAGKPEADLELWPEDLVVIPSAARVVYVLGAVAQPGWFDIPADTRMTASMALSRAGSFTKFAAKGSIQILRQLPSGESRKIPVELSDILAGQLEKDVVLEPGDVLWVPERSIF
ncbi:MAG: SLBB domain-containing protein [Candidatus Brocadiae bacterium]|nr:SLBB domain-containing protein [Candidatus Brocadiia bacterium]